MKKSDNFKSGLDLNSDNIERAVGAVKAGKLVVIPTDTVYGIAVDPDNRDAVAKLVAAKGRDSDKPIALLAADIDAVTEFGAIMNERERALAKEFWPGGLTLVLNVENGVPEGFRVPDLGISREIINRCGGVLRVSSANLSGEEPALTAKDAATALAEENVAVFVDAGPVKVGVASTVVRVNGRKIEILRQGALSIEELNKVMNSEQ
jgi:L-threonylcarbamoyladenylate synthase